VPKGREKPDPAGREAAGEMRYETETTEKVAIQEKPGELMFSDGNGEGGAVHKNTGKGGTYQAGPL